MSEPHHQLFFAWNLVLLAVPFVIGRVLGRLHSPNMPRTAAGRFAAVLLFALWLLFLPNAPYVIADVRHLMSSCHLNEIRICVSEAWSIPLMFVYAVTGWIGFVFAIRQLKTIMIASYGSGAGRWFVPLIVPPVSLGLLLGLLDRFNSWDAILSPGAVIGSAWSYFTGAERFVAFAAYTASLYALFYLGDYLFRTTDAK